MYHPKLDEDWAHQSSLMRDYYKYSFGTIAATGAANASEGLFLDCNPAFVPPFGATISQGGEERNIAVTTQRACVETLSKEPLNQRSWFLHERLLSLRILHFGRNHMSWECRTKLACESWPISVLSSLRSYFSLKEEYPFALHHIQHSSLKHDVWPNIVTTYSRMALTRLSDKCVAFAGIAEETQAVTQDDYVAGLWRQDLPGALLWTVNKSWDEDQWNPDLPARPQSYLAPSWSCLSVNRAVTLPQISENKRRIMVVIDAEVESVTDNKFGAIKHGVLSGWGALIPAICRGHDER